MFDELVKQCLSNYDFIRYKIMAAQDYNEVLQDYEDVPGSLQRILPTYFLADLLLHSLLLYPAERLVEPLKPIKVALQEAQPVLQEDAQQLANQLAARVLPAQHEAPGVKGYKPSWSCLSQAMLV